MRLPGGWETIIKFGWKAWMKTRIRPNGRPLREFRHYLPERYLNATEEQKAAGHWGGDFFIVEDFVNAIFKNEKPPIDVYDACEWTAVALLSELSVMNGGKVMDMPDFRRNKKTEEQRIKL